MITIAITWVVSILIAGLLGWIACYVFSGKAKVPPDCYVGCCDNYDPRRLDLRGRKR